MQFNTIVPKGGIYIQSNGYKYLPGEFFPKPKDWDRFIYEDYDYVYSDYMKGWGISVLDESQNTYKKILTSIAGKPITNLSQAFEDCVNMTAAPLIPKTVTLMTEAFKNCTSLVTILNIPQAVNCIDFAFVNCISLKSVELQNSKIDISLAFSPNTTTSIKGIDSKDIIKYKAIYPNAKFVTESKLSLFLKKNEKE